MASRGCRRSPPLIEPRGAGRRGVEVHLGMLREPCFDLGRPVGRRVVEDDMKLAAWIRAHDLAHESEEVARPERRGNGCCVRSNAWIEVFSSTLSTPACS